MAKVTVLISLGLQRAIVSAAKRKIPFIMVLNLPSTLLVNGLSRTSLDVVADDIKLRSILANEFLKNGADNGLHARRDDDGGDVVGKGPFEIFIETGVKLDVINKVLDALWVRSGDAVHHLLEGLTEQ